MTPVSVKPNSLSSLISMSTFGCPSVFRPFLLHMLRNVTDTQLTHILDTCGLVLLLPVQPEGTSLRLVSLTISDLVLVYLSKTFDLQVSAQI